MPATPPRRSVSPTTSTRSSCTCANPARHRRRWRSTNLLERSLAEVKRRTKVIGRFPGETSCLTLVWAVLDLYITHAKNGVRFSQLERQRLRRIRHAGSEPTTDEEVTAA
jgi:putative transposase